MEKPKVATQPDDVISLKELSARVKDWFTYLVSKWVVILAIVILGTFLGLLYAYFKKPLYTASTTFVLEEGGSGGLGQYAGIASIVGIDLGGAAGGIFQGDNIIELYKSRTMIERALLSEVSVDGKSVLPIDLYIHLNELRKAWGDKPELQKIQFYSPLNENTPQPVVRLKDSIIGVIVEDINKNYLSVFKPDKKLSIISVQVKATDEIFAKTFNAQMVKTVNDFYVQTKTKKSLNNIAILQRKTDSVRTVLNGAIYKTVAVADNTPNLNQTRQVQRMAPMQRSQFTAETNKAILGELVKNLEVSKMSLLQETPLIQVIDQPVLPLKMEKFGKAKGIVLGGIIAGFIATLLLTLRKMIKDSSN